MKTKDRLAEVLEKEGLKDMADRARAGYYDDFESELAMPIGQLVSDLNGAGKYDLAKRAINGEFDGTKEEGDAWFQKEGKDLLKP